MSDAEIAENQRAADAFGREFDAAVSDTLWADIVAMWTRANPTASPKLAEPPP
jgi:hypothetical protein